MWIHTVATLLRNALGRRPITAAYVSRDIDERKFSYLLTAAVSVPTERALLTELAELKRRLSEIAYLRTLRADVDAALGD